MTKPLIEPKLRFKLDMIAAKHNVSSHGLTIGQVVAGIMKAANDLTTEEKRVLDEVCKSFEASLADYEEKKGAAKK